MCLPFCVHILVKALNNNNYCIIFVILKKFTKKLGQFFMAELMTGLAKRERERDE